MNRPSRFPSMAIVSNSRSALKEWKKLDGAVREQFKKKLPERLPRPCVKSARLKGMADCYKIKLKNAGYRLVYQVDDGRVVVIIVTVGRRENLAVYKVADKRVEE